MVYHNVRQLWLVLGVKLMEINRNLFSRYLAVLPFLGWLYSYISDPLKWLSDLQIRDQKLTLNHLVYNSSSWCFFFRNLALSQTNLSPEN